MDGFWGREEFVLDSDRIILRRGSCRRQKIESKIAIVVEESRD